jgi:hypothetical protein
MKLSSRPALLSAVLFSASQLPSLVPPALAYDGEKKLAQQEQARLEAVRATFPKVRSTDSGIIFFDLPFGTDLPAVVKALYPEVLAQPPLPPPETVNEDGTTIKLVYRVRERKFDGEIVEASDSIGLGIPQFNVGDGSVNAAIDELARTLPSGVTRRAVVPSSFRLIREDQVAYFEKWPVPSFVELSIRKPTDSNPVFRCDQVDGSCICNPTAAREASDLQSKRD